MSFADQQPRPANGVAESQASPDAEPHHEDLDWVAVRLAEATARTPNAPSSIASRLEELIRGKFAEAVVAKRDLRELAQQLLAADDTAPPEGEPQP